MLNLPSLRISVTGNCNLACQYCPIHGDSYILKQSDLSKEELIKIIDQLHKKGINAFSITGGEPLISPDITFSISKHIRSYPEHMESQQDIMAID